MRVVIVGKIEDGDVLFVRFEKALVCFWLHFPSQGEEVTLNVKPWRLPLFRFLRQSNSQVIH